MHSVTHRCWCPRRKTIPFLFLWPCHNFPLTKSLILNGLIPKQSTTYYSTICTLYPVWYSAYVYCVKYFVCVWDFRHSLCFRLWTFFVFQTFDVVFVWDFRHSFRWHYLTDTGHLKRRCSGALLSCLGFCRRSETVRQRRSSVDGKSAMALAIGFLYLPLCGVPWRGGGDGEGGVGGPRELCFLSSCLWWKHFIGRSLFNFRWL